MFYKTKLAKVLPQRLYEERTKRGLSVNQLCNVLSTSNHYVYLNPKTYYRYEAGKSPIPIYVLHAIAELYAMNVQDFFEL